MAEQEKPKKSLLSYLWSPGDEEPEKPAVQAPQGSLPIPAAIPGRTISAAVSVITPQSATVDQEMVDRIMSDLEASAPKGYKEFVGDLATLANALPTEDLLYKSALSLASSKGNTAEGLSLDYEKCLRILDEQGREFDASVQEQITNKVGGRQTEVARLDGEIAKLNEQLTNLQNKRTAEAEAIQTDTARIEMTKLKFHGAFSAVQAKLNDQKIKLATFGKKG